MASPKVLVVAGVCLRGEGYPNAQQTLEALRCSGDWVVDDLAEWLPEGLHLWKVARAPWLKRASYLLGFCALSALSLCRAMRARGRGQLLYAPYPSIFLLAWCAFLPGSWRPKVIADAYISLWDSMFRDRSVGASGVLPRIVRWFEARALSAAHRVIVDTEENRAWMVEVFRLEPSRVVSMPLAVNSGPFLSIPPPRESTRKLTVLFVGTLIPLHGIKVIADAIRLLGPDAGIAFRIIGDGQESGVIQDLLASGGHAETEWRRTWASTDELVSEIELADVCLGVFGGEGKASRVLPFKVYLAMASGRPVVTQARASLPSGAPVPPWLGIEPEPRALADALLHLHRSPDLRASMGRASRRYFNEWLSADSLVRRWNNLVD